MTFSVVLIGFDLKNCSSLPIMSVEFYSIFKYILIANLKCVLPFLMFTVIIYSMLAFTVVGNFKRVLSVLLSLVIVYS